MKAYKGFKKTNDGRIYCQPVSKRFYYEEGKTYKTDRAELCECGFHACLDPIDCLDYYYGKNAVYHEVELEGVSDERGDDSKVVGTKITIGREISIDEMIKISVVEFHEKYKQPRRIIQQNRKYHFIKADGTRLNDAEYDFAYHFKEGFAVVRQNGKYHFIKTDGTRLNNEEYEYVWYFQEGFAHVKQNGEWFYINTKGERVD